MDPRLPHLAQDLVFDRTERKRTSLDRGDFDIPDRREERTEILDAVDRIVRLDEVDGPTSARFALSGIFQFSLGLYTTLDASRGANTCDNLHT